MIFPFSGDRDQDINDELFVLSCFTVADKHSLQHQFYTDSHKHLLHSPDCKNQIFIGHFFILTIQSSLSVLYQ